jgi:BirA family transcriptional regulator, biotin operon repressor / biotin---[acetyl-CoA-carboxylase] ligase
VIPGLDAAVLGPRLSGCRLGRPLLLADRLESTNDLALGLLSLGYPEGTLVLAEEQSFGRGRQERGWSSPPGLGIYASLLFRPQLDRSRWPLLTLTAAVGVAQALEAAGIRGVTIKWPNDLMVEGRKLAGFLAETRRIASGPEGVVVGMGLNVHQAREHFPAELGSRAISLSMLGGGNWDRNRLIPALLSGWAAQHGDLLARGVGAIRERWLRHSYYPLHSLLAAGSEAEEVRGRFAGLGPSGELQLETEAGRVVDIWFGDTRRVREG